MVRERVGVDLLDGGEVEADDGGVEVEVGVHGGRVAAVLRQPEHLRQEHEGARDRVVDVPMPLPVLAVLEVVDVVGRPTPLCMADDPVEQVALHNRAGERRVPAPLERVVETERLRLLAGVEGSFG